MILTETQKAWRKMEIEELIEEYRVAVSNERLWAKGSDARTGSHARIKYG